MDFRLQLHNIADLSRRLADFCDDSLEDDMDVLSEEDQKHNMIYTLNVIDKQLELIRNVYDKNKERGLPQK